MFTHVVVWEIYINFLADSWLRRLSKVTKIHLPAPLYFTTWYLICLIHKLWYNAVKIQPNSNSYVMFFQNTVKWSYFGALWSQKQHCKLTVATITVFDGIMQYFCYTRSNGGTEATGSHRHHIIIGIKQKGQYYHVEKTKSHLRIWLPNLSGRVHFCLNCIGIILAGIWQAQDTFFRKVSSAGWEVWMF